jgi:LCP family protein required for cell wall assembly
VSDDGARHRGRTPRSRRVLKRVGVGTAIFLMALSLVALLAYKHLQGNINYQRLGDLGQRPTQVTPKAVNILVMGSDTREGANGKGIGGDTPGLSDTTMILHVSADRQFAYGVSLPRDAMVERPSCRSKDGSTVVPAGLTQFNAAYALGGPTCTVKTVEHLTGIRINHYVVVDFVGFRSMVNALHGVKICVPTAVNDTVGHISLPAGTYNVTGQQALDYVRVRHDLGAPTGDIGRMKRQQTFVSAMIKKAVSAGTLTNPVRLYKFLDAATKSITTDFSGITQLASLGKSLKDIGLDKVRFITVPWEPYPPDPNRVEWKPEAVGLWSLIKRDKDIGSRYDAGAVSPGSGKPARSPSGTSSGSPSGSPSGSASGTPTRKPSSTPTQTQAEKDAEAEAAGLCT